MINEKESGGNLNFKFSKEETIKPASELKSNSYFGVPSHKVNFSSLNRTAVNPTTNSAKTVTGNNKANPIFPYTETKKPFDPFPKKKESKGFKTFLVERRFLLLIVVILVLGMWTLTPVITGQTVLSDAEFQQMETTLSSNNQTIDNLTKELITTKTSLTEKTTLSSNLQTDKTDLTTKLSTATSELENLKTKLTALEKTEAMNKDLEKFNYDLKEKLADLKEEFDDLEDDYDTVVDNSARSICCKNKIDDSTINAYSVKDGKVTCLTSGGKALSCSFS